MHNKNVLEMFERLDLAFEALKKQLVGRLHDVVRKQLFGDGNRVRVLHYANKHQNGSAAFPSGPRAPRFQCVSQPYVYKPEKSGCVDDSSKLKIAIVGFGNFGQFLAKPIISQGHMVLAYSRADYSDVAQRLGVSYYSDADGLCQEHPELILVCTSILSTESLSSHCQSKD